MARFFEFIGMMASAGFVAFVVCTLVGSLKEFSIHLKWKWAYKHRFDKKPLAKCYCRDCIYSNTWGKPNDDLCKCVRHSFKAVSSDFYCKNAHPRSMERRETNERNGIR